MRRTENGLQLDLTENTPGSNSSGVSRLPNLVEHAETCHPGTTSVTGENLNSKLPNVVEGSMDYGSERRSSRYLEYDPKTSSQDGQATSNSHGAGGDVGYGNDARPASYSSRSFERKPPSQANNYERENVDGYDSGNRKYPEEPHVRYDRRTERTYQQSDLDAPYERNETTKLRGCTQDIQEGGRRYSRDLTDYEYCARYAEDTLKLEPKKNDPSHQHHGVPNIYEPVVTSKGYDTLLSKGYESGIKTRDSSYEVGLGFSNQQDHQPHHDIGSRRYETKYHSVGKMYGTLPRYESSASKTYDPSYDATATGSRSFDPKYGDSSYEDSSTRIKSFEVSASKYDLTTSKSYERSKYEPVSRYQDPPSSKSYEQTVKMSEPSTTVGSRQQHGTSAYSRKDNQEARDSGAAAVTSSEKSNGYKKNNFEAYGVYSDPEDEHGFRADKKPSRYSYKGVVVNASGESAVVDQKRAKQPRDTQIRATSPWCRPTILLLLLVLFVVIFVFVAGILLYFNYMSYKPRHPVVEEPCEKTYCAWGAMCIVSENGRAQCQCPVECSSSPAPVCGSDDVTYTNHCQLRQASCQRRKNTRIKHQGPCELKDPCNNLNCSQGSECVRSRDGSEAKCECLETCPSLGDHEGDGPACGTDGIDYPTVCHLNKSACTRGVNVSVAFRGKCDPCGSIECTEPEVCQLDSSRKPACRCGEECGLEFSPVCGSDGKTYSNECSLRQEACRSRLPLRKIYTGACSSGTNPCDDAQCSAVQQCAIDRYGIAKCECGPECQPVMRPVCAKGGTTYSSFCELNFQACLMKTRIELAYIGKCGSQGPCSEKICQWGAMCAENGNNARCECPTCSMEFDPVCGDDGISYGNECKLRLEACQHHREIRVLYQGLCNGCENKKCQHYGKCESDGSGEAKCVCPDTCDEPTKNNEADTKVCATDGVTYMSECAMMKASCASQTRIAVNYRGDCEMCVNVECNHGSRCVAGNCICPEKCPDNSGETVCGSDGKNYRSECELQRAACDGGANIPGLRVIFYGECGEKFTVAALTTVSTPTMISRLPTTIPAELTSTQEREACKDIHCDFEATCELGPDKFPRCTCKFDCTSITSENATPVCGSDLKTYPSICVMKTEACQRQQEVRLRPLDLCQGMEVKPCNGDAPLTDADGQEYDCGSGPDRRDCPSNHYCHQTTRFARCCKKVQGIQVIKCSDAWHGCCPDGITAALGPKGAGCPSLCNCNRLGSISDTCNPETEECECKPGVGGLKCDRCMPGYWGLPKISEGHQGCIPCGCSLFGSVREDCEQMTGRCVCKPEIQGHKCTICTDHNKILTSTGCYAADKSPSIGTNCNELECYSGGQCSELGGPHCVCPSGCPVDLPSVPVCGSDGQTYDNECELRLYACRHQADVVTQAFGHCRDDPMANTDFPVKRYTAVEYTEPASAISPLSKSTRHLLGPDPDARYYYTHRGQEQTITIDRDNLKHGVAAASRPTPATIRVVAARLGDYCNESKDCTIRNSECLYGGCICSDGFSETSDRRECYAENYVTETPAEQFKACLSSPCEASSTCIDLPSSTFVCICRPNFTGLLCDEEINKRDYEIPSFDGKSYVRMSRLKAYHKFNIELEFKTYAENGIILYNEQKNDGTGDFLSLAIVDGFVEFRYNLGNGPVLLTSPDKVTMKNYHRIVAKRYHKDGVLIFNDGDDIAGQSEGMLRSLDLNQDTFVGNVPTNYTRVYENIGTSQGLVGCIRKLKIDRVTVDLHIGKHKDVLETYRVKECRDNGCANLPCHNGATCLPIFDEDLCNGRECHSTSEKPKAKRKNKNKNNNNNNEGAVNIVRCKGSHCTAIEKNHKRSKKKNGSKSSRIDCPSGDCQMDDQTYINETLSKSEEQGYRCMCLPQYTGKNCEESLDPCMGEPCQHGATCDILPQGGYVCKCPPGRAGKHCEILDSELKELLIPELTGDGFLELPCLGGVAKAFSIELWFLTRSTEGLLLYNGQLNNGRGDFISLNLVKSKIQFRFNLGSGIANITSPDTVSLDTWHCVRISRLGREGLVQLDDGTVARGFSGNPLTELNLEMPLYIGGVKHWRQVNRLAEARSGLDGAIQRLMVNGKTYQNLAVNVTQHNTEIYDGLPCPNNENPCHNGGVCLPLLNSYLCKCATNYNGLHCEFFMGYDVSSGDTSQTPVRFDGVNFLQFKHRYSKSANTTLATNTTLVGQYFDQSYSDYDFDEDIDFDYENYDYGERKGQQSNKFELSIRTTHSDGLIAWIGRGKLEHLVLSLQEGYVVLTHRTSTGEIALRSKEKIDDGVFHRVKAFRKRKATIIQIDDESPAKLMTEPRLLVTNGKLFVGGKPGHRGMKGCVTDFIIDKRRLTLVRRKTKLCHDNDV